MAKTVREIALAIFLIVLSVSVGYLTVVARDTAADLKATAAATATAQRQLIAEAQTSKEILNEAAMLFAVRFFEQERSIPAAEAARISKESVDNIKKLSPRWGELIEYAWLGSMQPAQ